MKQDIRATGSGNIGATNVARSGAKGLAIATLALDALKGSAAVLLALKLTTGGLQETKDAQALAALFVILGHCFPAWLKFKGGKGVATALGAFVVLTPRALVIALAVFLVTVWLTRYVSLGSVLAAVTMPVASFFFGMPKLALLLLSVACLVIILKHRQNISRLLSGTENKFGETKA
jgi:acyl phosphate:glycerol-3-phosphate acyltransferase